VLHLLHNLCNFSICNPYNAAGGAQYIALEALLVAAKQQQQDPSSSSSSSSSSSGAVLQGLNLDKLMRCPQARVLAYLQHIGADV
jgi:hypothetical protein